MLPRNSTARDILYSVDVHRWFVTVVWLLVVALPLQAWAACSGCHGHAGRSVTADAHATPCHDDPALQGMTAASDPPPFSESRSALADRAAAPDTGGAPDAAACDGCDGCPTCAAGHGSATGPTTAETADRQVRSPAPAPAASTEAPSFLTPGPDRPPRSDRA